jgi:hypothetical protein
MNWWLAIRRVRASTIAVALLAAILVAVGGLAVTVPALFAVQGLALPVGLLAPLIVSTSVSHGLARGDETTEAVAVRPIILLDIGYAVVAAGVTLGVGAALHWTGWSNLGIEAGRNGIGFIGLALIGRRTLGRNAGAVVPAVVALLLAFFGGDASGRPQWWAWIVTPPDDPRSWAFAVGFLVVGVCLSMGRTGRAHAA